MIELEVKVPDKPGTLVKLIQPISENAGNIHGILHNHKDKNNGYIPVLITFEIKSEDRVKSLEKIKQGLIEQNFQILKITDIPASHNMTVILSGHVFRHSFEETVRQIDSTGARVYDLEAKFTHPDDISNVKFTIEIPDEINDDSVIEELNKICENKELLMILEERL